MVESKREEECFRLLTLVLQCLEEWGETAIGGCLEFGDFHGGIGFVGNLKSRIVRSISADIARGLIEQARRHEAGLLELTFYRAKGVPTARIPSCKKWAYLYPVTDVTIQGNLAHVVMRSENAHRRELLGVNEAHAVLDTTEHVRSRVSYLLPWGRNATLFFTGSRWILSATCPETDLRTLAALS